MNEKYGYFVYDFALTKHEIEQQLQNDKYNRYIDQCRARANAGYGAPYCDGYLAFGQCQFEDVEIDDFDQAVEYCLNRCEMFGPSYGVITHDRETGNRCWVICGILPH